MLPALQPSEEAYAGCNCQCPAGQCWDGGTWKSCDCGGGGGNPPTPVADDPTPDDGGGGGGGGGGTCGDGSCSGGETCASCPGDCGVCPTATPVPWGEDDVEFNCYTWSDCDSGYAHVLARYIEEADAYVIMEFSCQAESACVPDTPVPSTPEPDAPCDYPPTIDGGIIHQPCDDWPGWRIDAEVTIPPNKVLRNPWPRGLAGLENNLWFQPPSEPTDWSSNALNCPDASAGTTHDSSTFDCGGGVGSVSEGGDVNYQIGVRWRRWDPSDGSIHGKTPPAEVSWTIHDRDFNGGDRMLAGRHISYVFETSSYGLERDGPAWNPECQDRTCGYDERVSGMDAPAYDASVTTYWWPEWNKRWLHYKCSSIDWGDCACFGGGEPGGLTKSCTPPSGICIEDGQWYGKTGSCGEWKFVRKSDGWTKYDLRDFGAPSVFARGSSVQQAGADPSGSQRGSFIPGLNIPIIEVQPVGTGGEE